MANATFNLKLQVLPDGRGASWRTERAVMDAVNPDGAAGVWLGSVFGILASRTLDGASGVWWITSARPDDPAGWDASTAVQTGMSGQIWGLALNSAGVLCALVGTATCVSRDRGKTWRPGGSPSGLDGGKPATIVAQEHLLVIIQPGGTSGPPHHWVSVDGGMTFV